MFRNNTCHNTSHTTTMMHSPGMTVGAGMQFATPSSAPSANNASGNVLAPFAFSEQHLQGVQVLKILAENDAKWVSSHPAVLDSLVSIFQRVLDRLSTGDDEEVLLPTQSQC